MEKFQCYAGEHCMKPQCNMYHPPKASLKNNVAVEHLNSPLPTGIIHRHHTTSDKRSNLRPRKRTTDTEMKRVLGKEKQTKEQTKKLKKTSPKCGICEKVIQENRRKVSCEGCKTCYHVTCTGLKQIINDYYCMDCMGNELEVSRIFNSSLKADVSEESSTELDPTNQERSETVTPVPQSTPSSPPPPTTPYITEEEKRESEEAAALLTPSQPKVEDKEAETSQTPTQNNDEGKALEKTISIDGKGSDAANDEADRTPVTESFQNKAPQYKKQENIYTLIDETASSSFNEFLALKSPVTSEDSEDEYGTANETENSLSDEGNTDETETEEEEEEESTKKSKDESIMVTPLTFEEYLEEVATSGEGQEKTKTETNNIANTHFIVDEDNVTNKTVYRCKLCKTSSSSSGGIKNHITRTHKVVTVRKENDICRKCRKSIHDTASCGTCSQCGGKEHFRCTKTSKENEEEHRNGSLLFTCSLCCAPGLWDMAIGEEEEEKSEETITSIIQEKESLTVEVERQREKESRIIQEAQGIAEDNTLLVKEINIMNEERRKLQNELVQLRGNNQALAVECNNLKSKCRNTEVTYEKSKEVALAAKSKMSNIMKDAKSQIQKKNDEIRSLMKLNEKLTAENASYSEIVANLREEKRRNMNTNNRSAKERRHVMTVNEMHITNKGLLIL